MKSAWYSRYISSQLFNTSLNSAQRLSMKCSAGFPIRSRIISASTKSVSRQSMPFSSDFCLIERFVSSTNNDVFNNPDKTTSALRWPPSSTARLFRASIKLSRSPSTPASIASYFVRMRHAELMVSDISIGERVSDICSPAGCVVRISRYGVTNRDKNASIVEIGASSSLLSSISTSPFSIE